MSIPEAARDYCAAGWVLVEFPRGSKGPNYRGWNDRHRTTSDPLEAALFNDNTNIGLCHAYARTAVLDIDAWPDAARFLADHGIHLDELFQLPSAVRISSGREGRGKLVYRLPDALDPLTLYSLRPPGSGLELRCATRTGSTVQDVLPPSIHPITGKPYTWEYGDPIAGHWSALPLLPEPVLALWRSLLDASPADAPHNPPKGLAADRLRGLLARIDPDAGYHEWTKVGSALHHETEGAEWGLDLWDEWSRGGAKYVNRADLAPHWNSWGRYKGRPITIQSLISMAGGVDVDEFDDLTTLPEQPQRARFEVVPVGSFAAGPSPEWIIKGLVPAAVSGVLFAESGAGKSFAIFDMGACVARGIPWNGRKVRQGRVVYIAAEGAGGLRKRAAAYGKFHGIDLDALPFGIIADRPNLLKDDHRKIADQVNAWGGADLLIVDTLAQSMAGGDENSGEDVGKVLAHAQALHAATGAMVILVHHSGKDATRGARGWSGLKAAMDCELEITREGEARVLRVSKQKDGEDGLAFAFRLQTVDMGVDVDGDPITSCVVQWVDMPATQRRGEPPEGWQRQVWEVVQDNLELCEGDVPIALILDKTVERMPADPNGQDRRRDNAKRALDRLIQTKWLVLQGKCVAAQKGKL